MSTRVRELLTLPEHVSKGDFVQSLAESLRNPDRAVATYAVTPDLVGNFQQALKAVTASLANGRSQPIFLHGSFGSGKSHFMAMLHLMLQGDPAPWRKPELHAARDAYAPLQGKKLLQLHYHMLGAKSFESRVFQRYVEHVRAHHPEAPLPSLFEDQEVFKNATHLRETMGDAAFFAALNKGKAVVAGFGKQGAAAIWNAAKFEAAQQSTDPQTRAKLLTALTKTLLPAFAGKTDDFVGVDEGLGAMSRHAASLGYDGIVLYLDELILWLASKSASPQFVQDEVTKLVKLKEAQDEHRAIPIISFIARQRDLSALMGEGVTGAERAMVSETISHHKSRFDTIDLSDSNLRAIIPHRVVTARSPDDRQRLEDGFEAMWRSAKTALTTLQGGTANRAEFRQVYPFSPALIDVLVVLSNRLQRDRTAIRILVEMLVDHLPELALGEVVPVGAVFDLVAGSDDAVDGASRTAFKRARELYQDEVLPWLQARHKTDTPAACQRMKPGHPSRIGCSGCPQVQCRNDNRLVKTVLLAALVPKAAPFDGLTVKRLVHLNHGAVKAPVETMAVNLAATRLRELARQIHAIRIADGANPMVSVSLQSVDLKPILERAETQDTRESRRFILRTLLWHALGLAGRESFVTHKVDFRHTSRTGRVRFGNVRTLRASDMRCPDDADWMVVIDYPFDEKGFTPHDDERHLITLQAELGGATSTLVWLPTFFTQQLEEDLGDLAKLEHILNAHNLRGFLSHVNPDDQQQARLDLESLRARKKSEVTEGLKKAYGLTKALADDPHVDANRSVTQHVHSLGVVDDPRRPRAATMAAGLTDLADQILTARYPEHPTFRDKPTPQKLNRIRGFMERLLDEPGTMLYASKEERDELQKIAEPLTLCRVYEQRVEQIDRRFDAIEGLRAQSGVDNPTLSQVRGWLDQADRMGLPTLVANVVAWLWAHKYRRVALIGSTPQAWPSNGKLADHLTFVKPELPSEDAWSLAIEHAGLLGVTAGKALNARNTTQLASNLRALSTQPQTTSSTLLPALLEPKVRQYGAHPARINTAHAVAKLLEVLPIASACALLEALAAVDLSGTSHEAIRSSVAAAPQVAQQLRGAGWTVLSLLNNLLGDDRKQARAQSIIDRVGEALGADECITPLCKALQGLVNEAEALLKDGNGGGGGGGGGGGRTDWTQVWRQSESALLATEALETVQRLQAELSKQLGTLHGELRVNISLSIERKEPKP